MVLADLKLPQVKEPFRWQVSQILPAPSEPEAEAQPSEPVAKPAPAPPKSAKPVPQEPTPQVTEVRQVEAKPLVQEARRVVRAVQAQTVPAMERPATRPVTREVKAVEQNQAAEVAAPATLAQEHQSRTAEVMTKTGPVTAERAAVTHEAPAVVAQAGPAAVEAAGTAQTVYHAPVQRKAAHGPLSPVPIQPAPIQEAKMRAEVSVPLQKPIDSKPAEPAPPVPAAEPRAPEPPALQREQPAAEAARARSGPATKADYGWLADTLRRRVAEVKRYPPAARMNHWEGKVILHAVINEEGHLADIRIHESSGHEVLDEAAIEAVRHVCPLALKHPLGRAQVAIRIPINYTLND